MDVALLHYAAPPVVGGVETVIARQAQQFAKAGHQVVILAGRGEKWDVNIPVHISPYFDSRYPKILKMKAELDNGAVPEDFQELVEQVEQALRRFLSGVDVLIAHNVASLHKNLALTTALYNLSQTEGTPHMILWHHDLAWTTPRYADELHEGHPWDILKNAWPGVRQVTISQERRQELAALMDISPEEIEVIPGGLDLEDFLGLSQRTVALIEEIPIVNGAPLLLTPVRITRRKNLELAVLTLAALRKKLPEALLVITGPPGAHNPTNRQYFRSLQRLRKKHHLEGALFLMAEVAEEGLPERSVTDFYRLMDALFFPSREEGFGIPLLEAGLSRMPIFCSRIPQLAALAGDYATYFSPDDDPEYIAGLIVQRLEADPVYRWRVKVRRNYTWNAIYQKQIAPLLEEV